jgi:hypothetical protein
MAKSLQPLPAPESLASLEIAALLEGRAVLVPFHGGLPIQSRAGWRRSSFSRRAGGKGGIHPQTESKDGLLPVLGPEGVRIERQQ